MMQKKFLVAVFFMLSICLCTIPVALSLASEDIGDSQAAANADMGIEVIDGLVSMDVRDAEIRCVLQEIARKAKIALDIGDDIDGRVTISAKALPLKDILKRLCENRAVVYQYIPEKKTCRIISVGAYSRGKSDGHNMQKQESRHSNKKPEPGRGERLYDSRGRLLYKPGELLVKFKKGATEKQIADLHKSLGSTVLRRIDRLRLERVKLRKGLSERDAIKAYMSSGIVEIAERHALRYTNATTPNDEYFGEQWGLEKIRAPEAWDFTTGNPEIIIAVIDTGVDYSHPDLAKNIWVNVNEVPGDGVDNDGNGYVDDIYGWDFAGNDEALPSDADSDPMDVDGHGTHVAGIIAAKGNNNIGIAGVCWNAKIMALKVQADNGEDMDDMDIIEAISYAIDNGAQIVNCSFGGGGPEGSERDAFVDLKNNHILAVCAAGNDGVDTDLAGNENYPSCYSLENIISVAASDQNDNLASISNYGPTSVDIMAPGEGIKSTVPAAFYTDASVTIGAEIYTAYGMAFAGTTDAEGITALLYDCKKGYSNEFPAGVSGNIALIERGKIDEYYPDFRFSDKVSNAQAAGATAVIIYNNVSSDDPLGEFDNWTLGASGDWPPVVCISREDGLALKGMSTPQTTVINTLANISSCFGNKSGTSMAAPHVSGIAGLILSKNLGLDYSDVKSMILNTVDKVSFVSNMLVSGGRVNALAAVAGFLEQGDVSGDGNVELDDAILALQITAGMHPNICNAWIQLGADVNGDRRIGLEEAIYILQKVAGLRF